MAGPTRSNTGRTSSPSRTAPARRAAPAAPAAAPSAPTQVAAAAAPAPEPVVAAPVAAPAVAAPATAPHPAPARSAPAQVTREYMALLYGLLVVVAGFGAILIALTLVLINKTGIDASGILGVVTTSITGLGGAAIGFAVGQQGTSSANRDRAAAEAAKDAAQMRTIKFAAHMDPTVGRRLVE